MFCVGDDRHRVALLEDFLAKSGQSVTLHTRPVTEPSDPCLVACTARALRTPWIVALFDAGVSVVALRLDDTALPGPCLRAVNLQSWPARTADRKVADLVDWLTRQGGAGERPGAAAAGGARRPSSGRSSDTRRALLVLLLLVGGGALLLNLAPERRPGGDDPAVEDDGVLVLDAAMVAEDSVAGPAETAPLDAGAPPLPAGVAAAAPAAAPDRGAGAAAVAAEVGGTPPAGPDATGVTGGDSALRTVPGDSVPPGRPLPAGSAVTARADAATATGAPDRPAPATDGGAPAAAPAAQSTPRSSAAADPPAGDPPAPAAAAVADDALAHLCAARSLAAARAWADALSWKQRRRAGAEPCVERLLARPGYAPLRARLTRR